VKLFLSIYSTSPRHSLMNKHTFQHHIKPWSERFSSFYPMTSGISSGWPRTWADCVAWSVSAYVFGKSLTLFDQQFNLDWRGGWESVCFMRRVSGGGWGWWAAQLSKLFISHPLDGIPHHFIHPQTLYNSLNPSWVKGSSATVMLWIYIYRTVSEN